MRQPSQIFPTGANVLAGPALSILIMITRHTVATTIKEVKKTKFIIHKRPHSEVLGRGEKVQAWTSVSAFIGVDGEVSGVLRFHSLLADLKHKSETYGTGRAKQGHSSVSYLGQPGVSERGISWVGAELGSYLVD